MAEQPRRSVLVVDDDQLLLASLQDHLGREGLEVVPAPSAARALELCGQRVFDVVVLDQKLPDGSGHELCGRILALGEETKIIFITAYPSFDSALVAIRAGAHDYLCKPFHPDEVSLAVQRALRVSALEAAKEVQRYREEREHVALVGDGLAEVRHLVELASARQAPVLLTGETGTGKNVAARAIHASGPRSAGPLLTVNCAALPESMVEAELFGHERGAFTGASGSRRGLFELAEGGTLLLDEIGEMPLHLQVKLLSVLDEKKVRRIGGETVRQIDFRILTASNSDLEQAVARKAFRQDLYFRLCVVHIHLPPLRERLADLPALCACLLREIAPGAGLHVGEAELRGLGSYAWPGNVRELRNVLERAAILAPGRELHPSGLLASGRGAWHASERTSPAPGEVERLETVVRRHLATSLEAVGWNYSRAARLLGMSLSTLRRRVEALGLRPPAPARRPGASG